MKKIGAYLPGAYEEVVDVVDAYVLTEKVSCKALSSIIIDSEKKRSTSCNSTESMTSEKRLLKFCTGDIPYVTCRSAEGLSQVCHRSVQSYSRPI